MLNRLRRIWGEVGFTLMELLVVMTIIVILAAMLLPTLQEARKKAKYARWLSYSNNLRCDNRLVGYWNFEEGEGDRLKNKAVGPYGNNRYAPEKLNGTINNATWVIDGGRWPGKGVLEFDPNDATNDYVDCGNDSSIGLGTNDFTITCWVKVEGTGYQALIGNKRIDTQSQGYVLVSHDTAFGYYFKMGYGSGVPSDFVSLVSGTSELHLNQWQFVVVTRSANTVKMYVDSNEVDSDTCSYNLYSRDNVEIGGATSEYPIYLNGAIDEVAIFNRALSPDEVKQHYKMGKP